MNVITRKVLLTLLTSTSFSLNASTEFNFQNLYTDKLSTISEYKTLTPLIKNDPVYQNLSLNPQFAAITWNGTSDSDWFNGNNWSGGVPPTAADDVTIATTATAPVITQLPATIKSLTLNGTGALSIVNGGSLTSTGGSNIGQANGDNSSVLVDGTGSIWNSTDFINIGDAGAGSLTIQNQGTVLVNRATIGSLAGSSGFVLVDNGTWINSNNLDVGFAGNAILNIVNGGIVSNQSTTIGSAVNSSGIATVDGAGSQWLTADIFLGFNGNGSLTISNGAYVQAVTGMVLGQNNTATGILSVLSGGILETRNINKGTGSASVLFNGGILRANTSTNTFISQFAAGDLQIGSNGLFIDSNGFNIGTTNVLSGTGFLNKLGTGILTLSGAQLYTGNTIITNGTLAIGAGGSIAASSGVNLTGSTAIFDISAGGNQSIRDLSGVNGSKVTLGANTLYVNSTNSSIFSGSIEGTGDFIKQGQGMLTLNGTSTTFTGTSFVEAGTLQVNGILLGDMDVLRGGRLQGTGVLGNTTVRGVIAPGNSIGTLTVGNYTQVPGSIYEVEINASGQSDRIFANGTAAIGGSTIQVIREPGTYQAGTRYTILTATGGVNGVYSTLLAQSYPFLGLALNYDANHVYLDIYRTAIPFTAGAYTKNQINTAIATESLGSGNPVYDAISNLPDLALAPQAFDALSGEIHASALAVFVEDSRYVRSAITNRISQSFSQLVNNPYNVREINFNPNSGVTVWGQGFGAWGNLEGNRNAAQVDRSTSGFFAGADTLLGTSFRLGLMTGFGNSKFDVNARSSSGSSTNYYAALYGGALLGPVNVKAGGAYTWHDIGINRTVSFPGFFNTLHSNNNGSTSQAFAELGYPVIYSGMEFEPFVGVANVDASSGRFLEQTGSAALSGSGSQNIFYSTLGLREAGKLTSTGDTDVFEKLLLGWQHAYSEVNPLAFFNFQSGGIPFGINGVPIAENALLIDAALWFQNVLGSYTFKLGYMGEVANNVQDHGIVGVFTYRFA
ncbi:autotransporter outer membrane beta-barrel domain-containing protein [Legionella bononiensis]|uniref:Autotransporter domain-containing protein n=1 Tax=Legionella bononiensis TaxID=2793102 RepID=A0ABS1WG35_9GAMM|nr:autotransporter domain-containing protein [Legionella bononiensis]MBL7481774.1 autotransporter domain-containing protein [Legionella bononiensis]MBL7528323.1 autotransporter domain-containing protein [Legionella bononiensis]MBL7562797.1 autotransporter domain-containing protein [Legionella bononiensis]